MLDGRLRGIAAGQDYLLSRADVVEAGGSDDIIKARLASGEWSRLHAGVYRVSPEDPSWRVRLHAAVMAGGPESLASHRAALILWGLDGLSRAPIEITAPYSNRPIPSGVVVHRTRRPRTAAEVSGVPTTTAERTLLDCASMLSRLLLMKALESALRMGLTTVDQLVEELRTSGGRGVRGTRSLRWALGQRISDTSTDSGSETELLFHMRDGGLPEPRLQHELWSRTGRKMRPDFYWPGLKKAVEVDGLDAHDSAEKLQSDLRRQNEMLELGIDLRRFTAREVRRNSDEVVAEIRRFLDS